MIKTTTREPQQITSIEVIVDGIEINNPHNYTITDKHDLKENIELVIRELNEKYFGAERKQYLENMYVQMKKDIELYKRFHTVPEQVTTSCDSTSGNYSYSITGSPEQAEDADDTGYSFMFPLDYTQRRDAAYKKAGEKLVAEKRAKTAEKCDVEVEVASAPEPVKQQPKAQVKSAPEKSWSRAISDWLFSIGHNAHDSEAITDLHRGGRVVRDSLDNPESIKTLRDIGHSMNDADFIKTLNKDAREWRDWIDDENKAVAVAKALGVAGFLTVLNTVQAVGWGALSTSGGRAVAKEVVKKVGKGIASKIAKDELKEAVVVGMVNGLANAGAKILANKKEGKTLTGSECFEFFKNGFIVGFTTSFAGSQFEKIVRKRIASAILGAGSNIASQVLDEKTSELNRVTVLAAAILGVVGVELSTMKQPLSQFEKAVNSANMAVISNSIDALIKGIQEKIKE